MYLLQELTLKVCRIEDGRIIANTSTHEEVTSLQLLEFGYLVVIGREDGHVVTMKLMDPFVIGYDACTHCNLADRQNWVRIVLHLKLIVSTRPFMCPQKDFLVV